MVGDVKQSIYKFRQAMTRIIFRINIKHINYKIVNKTGRR